MKKHKPIEKVFVASAKSIKYFMAQMGFGMKEMAELFDVSVSAVFWWKEFGTKGSYYFNEKFREILSVLGLSDNDLDCYPTH